MVLQSQGAQFKSLAKEAVQRQPVPHHRPPRLQPAGLRQQSPENPEEQEEDTAGWIFLHQPMALPPWCPALPGPVSHVTPIARAAAANGRELQGLNVVIHNLHTSTEGLGLYLLQSMAQEKSTLQGEAGDRVRDGGAVLSQALPLTVILSKTANPCALVFLPS